MCLKCFFAKNSFAEGCQVSYNKEIEMPNENKTIIIPKSKNSNFATANISIPDEGMHVLYFYDVLHGQQISEIAVSTTLSIFPSTTTTSSTCIFILF